ncbi:iron-sulfur cluster biosynthesis family protein [Aquibacillus saliphilus]|uniref:iron-sulfur cluster biosynthesis family protein n=1 Tax=Aquibacillus saliphilus TaxID=1909422 RepID=UPI001CF050D3|nr:iron-sulfur cluster biosynthesis family protein [Aquibacillus saliphilus]
MKLTITTKALDCIEKLPRSGFKYLWLYFDTEGCGCGVSGMPTVRLTNTKADSFKLISSNEYQVIVHHQQAVFFADDMKLDYINNSFRLSSTEGILNPVIPVNDLINGDVA